MNCHKEKDRICNATCMRFVPGKPDANIPDQCMDNIATQYLTKLCKVGVDMLSSQVGRMMDNVTKE